MRLDFMRLVCLLRPVYSSGQFGVQFSALLPPFPLQHSRQAVDNYIQKTADNQTNESAERDKERRRVLQHGDK
jgi:hypothetical protein